MLRRGFGRAGRPVPRLRTGLLGSRFRSMGGRAAVFGGGKESSGAAWITGPPLNILCASLADLWLTASDRIFLPCVSRLRSPPDGGNDIVADGMTPARKKPMQPVEAEPERRGQQTTGNNISHKGGVE